MTNFEQPTSHSDNRDEEKATLSRRGLIMGGTGLAAAAVVGVGAFVGIPEYQRRKAESEKQEAKQEYLTRTDALTHTLIRQITDPDFLVDNNRPYYDYDSETGLLVFHSADREHGVGDTLNVSVTYPVKDPSAIVVSGEANAGGDITANTNILEATILASQPSRLEVYEDSSFGGTINYINMDENGELSYNHAFGDDDFVNPYGDLPASNLNLIESTLNTADDIVTSGDGEMFY